ncbi:MAG: SseB family protein [Pseudomonadota bacterium]
MSLIDRALLRMEKDPEAAAPRMQFFGRLVATELFLMLEKEGSDDNLEPVVAETEEGAFALVFDSEERLASAAGRPVPYAALPGGELARMLLGSGLGLALNSAGTGVPFLASPATLEWLCAQAPAAPASAEVLLYSVAPPRRLPQDRLQILDEALAALAGLAERAFLATGTTAEGDAHQILVVVNLVETLQAHAAGHLAHALAFSGTDDETETVDLLFLSDDNPLLEAVARVGLRFDLPEIPEPEPPKAPGTDPARPPRLR